MEELQDDNSQSERDKLSEDIERLKRVLEDEEKENQEEDSDDSQEESDHVVQSVLSPLRMAYTEDHDQEAIIKPLDVGSSGGELPVNHEACLMLNRAYQEMLGDTLQQLQVALDLNKEKQQLCKEMMEETVNKKQAKSASSKLPMNKYAMPFFKDKSGMVPPANTDTLAKQQCRERQGFIKPSRQMRAVEIEKLTCAVKSAVLLKLMQPLISKKELLIEKLEDFEDQKNPTTTQEELRSNISEIDEEIQTIMKMPDTEIFEKSRELIDSIDWMAISSMEFEGLLSVEHLKASWLNAFNPVINANCWTYEEDTRLEALVERHSGKHWNVIAEELNTGRTALQCIQRYMTRLHPATKPGGKKWSEEETLVLLEVVGSLDSEGYVPWNSVAEYLGSRTAEQCKRQYEIFTATTSYQHKIRWTQREDILLITAVQKFGTVNKWNRIAEVLVGRTPMQCRERYKNHIDNSLKFGEFSYTEDRRLLKMVQEYEKAGQPPSWAKIAETMPGRTDSMVLLRYKRLMFWKAQHEYINTLPEDIQQFILNHEPGMSKRRRDALEVELKKLKEKGHLKSAKRSIKVEVETPQNVMSHLNLTEEELSLLQQDINDGFFVPRPIGGKSRGPRDLHKKVKERMQVHELIRRRVWEAVSKKGDYDKEDIRTQVDRIFAGKHDALKAQHKDTFDRIKSVHTMMGIKELGEVVQGIVNVLTGKKPLKQRGRKKVYDDLDLQIEMLLAKKLIARKPGRPHRSKAENSESCISEEDCNKNKNTVCNLMMKALNVDSKKAVGVADCLLSSYTLERKKVEVRETAEPLLNLLNYDSIEAAASALYPDRVQLQQKTSENGEPAAQNRHDFTDEDTQDAVPDGNKKKGKKKTGVQNAMLDELEPVKSMYVGSAANAYKMPTLPPNVMTLTAFRSLLLDRRHLVKIAGNQHEKGILDVGSAPKKSVTLTQADLTRENLHKLKGFSMKDLTGLKRSLTRRRKTETMQKLKLAAKGMADGQEEQSEAMTVEGQEHRRTRLNYITSCHDYQMLEARFKALFMWPALLSSIRPEEQEKQPVKDKEVIETADIPEHHKQSALQNGKILGAGHRRRKYACTGGRRKRKMDKLSRHKKVEFLETLYRGRQGYGGEQERQENGQKEEAGETTAQSQAQLEQSETKPKRKYTKRRCTETRASKRVAEKMAAKSDDDNDSLEIIEDDVPAKRVKKTKEQQAKVEDFISRIAEKNAKKNHIEVGSVTAQPMLVQGLQGGSYLPGLSVNIQGLPTVSSIPLSPQGVSSTTGLPLNHQSLMSVPTTNLNMQGLQVVSSNCSHLDLANVPSVSLSLPGLQTVCSSASTPLSLPNLTNAAVSGIPLDLVNLPPGFVRISAPFTLPQMSANAHPQVLVLPQTVMLPVMNQPCSPAVTDEANASESVTAGANYAMSHSAQPASTAAHATSNQTGSANQTKVTTDPTEQTDPTPDLQESS